jgi:hypothetical protein
MRVDTVVTVGDANAVAQTIKDRLFTPRSPLLVNGEDKVPNAESELLPVVTHSNQPKSRHPHEVGESGRVATVKQDQKYDQSQKLVQQQQRLRPCNPRWLCLGKVVTVQEDTSSGVNKQGGVARIIRLHKNGKAYCLTRVISYIQWHSSQRQFGCSLRIMCPSYHAV